MRRSLETNGARFQPTRLREILSAFSAGFQEGEFAKIFPTTHFGFRKITRRASDAVKFPGNAGTRSRDLPWDETAFAALAHQQKKMQNQSGRITCGARACRDAIRARWSGDHSAGPAPNLQATSSPRLIEDAAKKSGVRLSASLKKAILNALSERDESAEICRDSEGKPEPDPELRDTENVPLGESIQDYFDREVRPYVPDAWINESVRDHKDNEIGKVGYEINFNRYFYKYQPPFLARKKSRATSKQSSRIFLKVLREVRVLDSPGSTRASRAGFGAPPKRNPFGAGRI